MPVSDIWSVPPIIAAVQRLQPKGILDLGIGFGKYGVLCREVLDAVHGRCNPESWEVDICGVEGFEAYANPSWGAYNAVAIEDFARHYQQITGWPLVLMVDSLEHVQEDLGKEILRFLVKHNKNVIVSVPMGLCPQGDVFGNSFEKHRTTFSGPQDFAEYNHEVLYMGVCCVVLIKGELE